MKLHLPIQLFKALRKVMLGLLGCALCNSYAEASDGFNIPDGYHSVLTNDITNILPYCYNQNIHPSDENMELSVAFKFVESNDVYTFDNIGQELIAGVSLSYYWLFTGQEPVGNQTHLSFSDNTGLIFRLEVGSLIKFKNLSSVSFNSNSGNTEGSITSTTRTLLYGHPPVEYHAFIFDEVKEVNVIKNSCTSDVNGAYGGAFFFAENQTYANDVYKGWEFTLRNNGHITFQQNYATSKVGAAVGGAIYSPYNGSLNIVNNEQVCFDSNFTHSSAEQQASSGSRGGAIWAGTLSINNNDQVVFRGNYVESEGGEAVGAAIYLSQNKSNLEILGNHSVRFEKNYENQDGVYRMRALYTLGDETSVLKISAADRGEVLFYDSIYCHAGTEFALNNAYRDSNGDLQKATGDIIFSGSMVETHLQDVKGGIQGTSQEILNSRTSIVNMMTNLYGGRLRIEDGAIYQGHGVTVADGANATLLLKNGELNQSGYGVTISSGSTLSALGENTITASTLKIQDGGTLQLALDMAQIDSAAVLTTTGGLSMNNIMFDLTGTEYLTKGEYKLITRTEGYSCDISGWTLNGVTSDQLRWEDGTLYYTGGHDWNHGVTDDDDISDLEEILGNLVVNGGDITLEAVVGAIQDAVDAGFGHGVGHIVINRGGIHITGAGDLDGHIIFNGDLKDIRKLFIEKDITSIKIDLAGSSQAENIVDVGDGYSVEVDELSGDGSMDKTGEGSMVIRGKGHKVGGTLSVQEGSLTFSVGDDSAGEPAESTAEIRELLVGNEDGGDVELTIDENSRVTGEKLHINGSHTVVTNEGTMEFTEEVRVNNGHLNNHGHISRVILENGKVSGSGSFAGLNMNGGELVVGNSPGLQVYTDDVELTEGVVTFSLADAGAAATVDTYGWASAAYSTIDMGGNALTLGENIEFVLEIGGAALGALVAEDGASLTFSLSLIQNIASESLTLDAAALSDLLANTAIIITGDADGLSAATLHLAGKDITSLLSDADYVIEGNTLVFRGTVTNDGSLTVPEPTTATLSLVALAALAMRRRRA